MGFSKRDFSKRLKEKMQARRQTSNRAPLCVMRREAANGFNTAYGADLGRQDARRTAR